MRASQMPIFVRLTWKACGPTDSVPRSGILIQQVGEVGPKRACLTGFQVMRMLPIGGPHLERQPSREHPAGHNADSLGEQAHVRMDRSWLSRKHFQK